MINEDRSTCRTALEYVLNNYDLPLQVRDRLEVMLKAIERRSKVVRKPTKKQVANSSIEDELVKYINENATKKGFTVTELIAQCDAAKGQTPQHIGAILRLARLGKRISRKIIKRVPYFVPYDPGLDESDIDEE